MEPVRMRRRYSSALRKFSELDAFTKMETNVATKATSSGGFATVFITFWLLYLTLHEVSMYWRIQQSYEFVVDQTRMTDHALQVNFDIIVKMGCSSK
jgi:Endoplasmic Reticulum-Golgi Intermediate Compartment (ERGIC)